MGCASSSLASRFREACDENNLEEVRRLLVEENAVSVINAADGDGATALHFANGWKTVNKSYETFSALENADDKVRLHKDAMHTTSLAFSRLPDTTALVQLLLENGAKTNKKTHPRGASPLLCAATVGRVSVVEALLSAGANINAVDEAGSTALHAAARYGHVEIVSMLLKAGLKIEAKDKGSRTPLMYASAWGQGAVVSLLLGAGADIKARDGIGELNALLTAAECGHAEVLSLLLAAGADIEARILCNWTALHTAAYHGHADVVSLLLAAGADIEARDHSGENALHAACSYRGKTYTGNEEVVSMLLDAIADIEGRDNAGNTALLAASSAGQVELVPLLLAAGADIEARDKEGRTALMTAGGISSILHFRGHTEVVSLLIAAGADIEARANNGRTALSYAAGKGNSSVVSSLLAAGADIESKDKEGNTVLRNAARCNEREVISLLLAAGAKMDNNGRTDNTFNDSLMIEALQGDGEEVTLLLAAGANVEASTALLIAAYFGYPEVVSTLLAAGADIEAKDKDGMTALLRAAGYGHGGVVTMLIAAGTNIEAKTNNGNTALMLAAINGRARIVIDLISAGAEVNAKGKYGLTPLIWAIEEGYPQIADDILTHGENVDAGAVTSDGRTARDHAKEKGYTGLLSKLEAAERNFVPPGPAPNKQRSSTPATQAHSTTHPTASSFALPMSCLPSAPEQSAPLYRAQTAPPTTPSPVTSATAGPVLQPASSFHSSWLIPYGDLQLGTELGRGSFAKVYIAKWQETDVAVKAFILPGGPEGTNEEFSASLLAKIDAEASLLASIRHGNVVNFLGMCHDPPCVVTEICSRGSLFDILRKAKTDAFSAAQLTWARRLSMAVDAATGMLHLHQRSPPVMHRDLKSPNLLVDSNWRVKVSDLGLSKLVEAVNTATTAGSTAGQLNPRWMAPEVVEGGHGTRESDIYAFGVVLWELLTWELPWSHVPNPVTIIAFIMRGDLLPLPAAGAVPGPSPVHTSTYRDYIAVIKQCTARVPAQRPQFADVVQKLKAMLEQEGGSAALGVRQGSSEGGSSAALSAVCVVCLEQPATAGLVHRSAEMVHRCCCEKCAKLLRGRGDACPMCRRAIDEVLLHFH